MKKVYFFKATRYTRTVLVLFTVLFSLANVTGQVREDFVPRTAAVTPGTEVYSIKGDFEILGNTNLTLQAYNDAFNNSQITMILVDSDSDTSTQNSSSADLSYTLSSGALVECTNVVFAGLYWSGRGANTLTTDQKRAIGFRAPGKHSQKLPS